MVREQIIERFLCQGHIFSLYRLEVQLPLFGHLRELFYTNQATRQNLIGKIDSGSMLLFLLSFSTLKVTNPESLALGSCRLRRRS